MSFQGQNRNVGLIFIECLLCDMTLYVILNNFFKKTYGLNYPHFTNPETKSQGG